MIGWSEMILSVADILPPSYFLLSFFFSCFFLFLSSFGFYFFPFSFHVTVSMFIYCNIKVISKLKFENILDVHLFYDLLAIHSSQTIPSIILFKLKTPNPLLQNLVTTFTFSALVPINNLSHYQY